MRKLTRLWLAFDQLPGMAAIPAYWRHLCGADYAVIEPFLQSTDISGATYPCVGCASRDCVRDIVDYGDGEILAVCKNQQSEKDYHTHDLGIFHEFVAGFAPENNLVKQKHDMTTIERRDGPARSSGRVNLPPVCTWL